MDINKILSKLFGNKSTRDMKLIQPLVEKVKEVYPAIAELDNDALRAKTKELQATVQHSADDLKEKSKRSKAKSKQRLLKTALSSSIRSTNWRKTYSNASRKRLQVYRRRPLPS